MLVQPTRDSRALGSFPPMSLRHRNLETLGRWHATIYYMIIEIFNKYEARKFGISGIPNNLEYTENLNKLENPNYLENPKYWIVQKIWITWKTQNILNVWKIQFTYLETQICIWKKKGKKNATWRWSEPICLLDGVIGIVLNTLD